MIKHNIAVALAATVTLAVAGCGNEENPLAEEQPSSAAQSVAQSPDAVVFELADMDGNLRQSSEWNGQPVMLNFWATWCAPCRREIPLLKETQDKYAETLGLQIVGIAVDFPDDVITYAEEAKFNYPILVGEEEAMAIAESSGVEFIGLPFTMLLSPSGELIKAHLGEVKESHITEMAGVLAQMRAGELDVEAARAALGPL